MRKISLLSVVKERDGQRYMAVDQILGDWAECAWLENGARQSRRFRLDQLETVPALGADDRQWREAFRAATHSRVG